MTDPNGGSRLDRSLGIPRHRLGARGPNQPLQPAFGISGGPGGVDMNVGRISERIGEPVVCLRSVSSGEKAPGPRRAEQAAPGDGGGVGRSLAPPRLSAGR